VSKLTTDLRRINIYNPYDFYGDEVYLSHRSAEPRAVSPAAWLVTKKGVPLGSHWSDGDSKSFSHVGQPLGPEGKATLALAQAFAAERFGVTGWARDPFSGYGPAVYVAEHLAFLAPLLAALPPAELPVWLFTSFRRPFGQVRLLVAAKTKAAAARAADEHNFRSDEISETGNADDQALARSEPGAVFLKPMNEREFGRAWRRLDTHELVEGL